jgi:hypothetical protein
MKRLALIVLLLVTVVIAVAGCGGSSRSPTPQQLSMGALASQRYYVAHASNPRVRMCFPAKLRKALPTVTGTGTSTTPLPTMSYGQLRTIVGCMQQRLGTS